MIMNWGQGGLPWIVLVCLMGSPCRGLVRPAMEEREGAAAAKVADEAEDALQDAKALERRMGRGPGLTMKMRETARAYELIVGRFPTRATVCVEALLRLGKLRWRLREPEQAKTAYHRVISTYPEESEAVAEARLEMAHLDRREGDWARARDEYRVTVDTADHEGTIGATAGVWLAKCHMKLGEYARAQEWLREFIDSFEDHPRQALEGVDLLISCWIELGKPEQGRRELREYVERFQLRARRAQREFEEIQRGLAGLKASSRLAKAGHRRGSSS